jgi:hypothetical protein
MVDAIFISLNISKVPLKPLPVEPVRGEPSPIVAILSILVLLQSHLGLGLPN